MKNPLQVQLAQNHLVEFNETMEKFIEFLQEAEKIIYATDHLIYVTFPLFKDKKLLLKMMSELKTAMANCINSVLQYEYLYKRITLYKKPKDNFKTFIGKCAPEYNIKKEETDLIIELFDIAEKHKQSSMEFIKNGKVIILSDNMKPETINIEKIKKFLDLTKDILKKIKNHYRLKED